MKKQILVSLASVLAVFFVTCKNRQTGNEKYCGYTLTREEAVAIKTEGSKTHRYTDGDLEELAEITTTIQNLFNDTLEMEVFYFLRDEQRIGIYINCSDNPEVLGKISCLLLGDKFKKMLPPDKYILFYSDESSGLVAGVKSRE